MRKRTDESGWAVMANVLWIPLAAGAFVAGLLISAPLTMTTAVGQHVQLQLDAFVSYLESRDNGSGARAEILVQF